MSSPLWRSITRRYINFPHVTVCEKYSRLSWAILMPRILPQFRSGGGSSAQNKDNDDLDAPIDSTPLIKPAVSPRPQPTEGNLSSRGNRRTNEAAFSYDSQSATINEGNYTDQSSQPNSSRNVYQSMESVETNNSNNDYQGDNRSRVSRTSNYAGNNANKNGRKGTVGFQRDPVDEMSEVSGSDDLEPVEVLLQFIPYYGQGDPANDSLVRSTLSSLSVEDIDAKDEYGNTLLLLACQYRCEDLVRIMLNKGADPNAVNTAGASCLHFACYQSSASLTIVKVLLQHGANPDVAETTYGCTPLHYCAGSGDLDFCKLILQYGGQIQSYDYYNYTCVDYAREAGHIESADYLQKRLDKYLQQNHVRNGLGSSKGSRKAQGSGLRASVHEGMDAIENWSSHVDPDTQAKYYVNLRSGECLWEAELKQRLNGHIQVQQQQLHQASNQNLLSLANNQAPTSATATSASTATSNTNNTNNNAHIQLLISQAVQVKLIAFLSKNDPAKLADIENILKLYNGREDKLFVDLYAKYKVQEDNDFKDFQKKVLDWKTQLQPDTTSTSTAANTATNTAANTAANSGGTAHSSSNNNLKSFLLANISSGQKVSDVSLIDPLLLQNLAQEAREKLATAFEAEKADLKAGLEKAADEERAQYRKQISEQEGVIVKLRMDVEVLVKEKAALQEEIVRLKQRVDALAESGGEAQNVLENELTAAKETAAKYKHQIHALESEVTMERDKLRSLEQNIASLSAGQEELVQQQQKAAEERLQQQRSREAQFTSQLQEMEVKQQQTELKFKSDMNMLKNEAVKRERAMKDESDNMRMNKDKEIDALRSELSSLKAKYAQDMSAAQMQVDDFKRHAEEMTRRAEEAEHYQKLVQAEIAEAKVVQKYNAQLHKDLLREQVARKKLHNDMEDMKGKIRVYVRVRPISNSERDRGCSEAVLKDGKMTVLVKGIGGPDNKKFYDFDQVFAGPGEGNTQTDVFKDTKHLIMSVIDGYNVCIFAYGQTGAGKSYTMIGGTADLSSAVSESGDFDDAAGVTPRAIAELFRLLNERTAQIEYTVEVSMFQLYRDGLEDLLKSKKKSNNANNNNNRRQSVNNNNNDDEEKDPPLKIILAEHSPTGLVHVEGAESLTASTPSEVMRIFARGHGRRTTASTMMNAESSRSHLICSIVVKLTNRRSGTQSVGKLTLVDLAGSERVDKSGASGEQLKEAQSINKSLSALGDVISALTSGQQHVPYRNHPLTMLMSDSIGGNAKTLMFVNTSPADYNIQESNNSLGFASRCKDITNMVSAGPGVQAAQVNALKKELAKLKKTGNNAPASSNNAARGAGVPALTRPDTAMGGPSNKRG